MKSKKLILISIAILIGLILLNLLIWQRTSVIKPNNGFFGVGSNLILENNDQIQQEFNLSNYNPSSLRFFLGEPLRKIDPQSSVVVSLFDYHQQICQQRIFLRKIVYQNYFDFSCPAVKSNQNYQLSLQYFGEGTLPMRISYTRLLPADLQYNHQPMRANLVINFRQASVSFQSKSKLFLDRLGKISFGIVSPKIILTVLSLSSIFLLWSIYVILGATIGKNES